MALHTRIKNYFAFVLLIVVTFTLLIGCNTARHETSYATKSVSDTIIKYANHLNIVENDSFTLVTIIDPWQGSGGAFFEYYLISKELPMPKLPDSARILMVPLEKIICTSTTHLSMLKAIGEERSLKGISGGRFVYDSTIFSMFDSGKITDIGYDTGLNTERIIDINPDLIMMYGVGGESAPGMTKLTELGINVMFNADYLEEYPLGKAEWIKLFGVLYGKRVIADSIFRSTEIEYKAIRQKILDSAKNRPTVLLGLPYRDTWYISPGNSYISRMIEDAGGNYIWSGVVSDISMPYSIEGVFAKASKADFWLNPGSAESIAEIISLDSRLKNLPPVASGNVFNNNYRISLTGGNDYWESGSINQDKILNDMAAILHPELFRDYVPYYYKKLK